MRGARLSEPGVQNRCEDQNFWDGDAFCLKVSSALLGEFKAVHRRHVVVENEKVKGLRLVLGDRERSLVNLGVQVLPQCEEDLAAVFNRYNVFLFQVEPVKETHE